MKKIALCIAALLVATTAHGLEAGAAKAEIIIAEGTPLMGDTGRLGRGLTGIHDPLSVRCLYLSDGTTSVFLVNADLWAITPELRRRVLEMAPQEVPPEHIILTATHTQNAIGGMASALPWRFLGGRFMPEVLDETARAFAQAMGDAYAVRQRAAIGYGTAKQDVLTKNLETGGEPFDNQIGAIRVDDSDGNIIAVVGNFSARPDTIPEYEHYNVSAGYPGVYYGELEALSSTGCVALFTNGATGDQGCANPEDKAGWERTSSIGRLVAIRVKGIANKITCGEGELRVGYAEPALPPTLAPALLPEKTVLQTLAINDLLLTFFPGRPNLAVAGALDDVAAQGGYAAHFVVSPANGMVFDVAADDPYTSRPQAQRLDFFGPGMAGWFIDEFSALILEDREATPGSMPPVNVIDLGPIRRVVLSGDAYQMGFQCGSLLKDAIANAFEERVLPFVGNEEFTPDKRPWTLAPGFVDLTPVLLPALGLASRPLLADIPGTLIDELSGTARGAEMPFDMVWLLHCPGLLNDPSKAGTLLRAPFCTMFSVSGTRAGADDLLVARNFDWPVSEEPLVFDVRPSEGHAFIQIGFPWELGAYSGMNDAGLVVCIERLADAPPPPPDKGLSASLAFRALINTAVDADAAAEQVAAWTHLEGYRFLLASPGNGNVRVVTPGTAEEAREPVDGLLLATPPGSEDAGDDAQARYERVAARLADERIIALPELKDVLRDQAPGESGMARIFNDQTLYSVIFQPTARTVHVAVPDETGGMGEYVAVSLDGDAS